MGNSNYNIDVKFQEAIDKAKAMDQEIINMTSILNELDTKIDEMTWNGAQATDFKRRMSEVKTQLDDVYKNYVKNIPEQIEKSVDKYKKAEET